MQSFSVYKRECDKRKKDTKWLVAWTTAAGKRKATTAYTDYEASVELGRKLAKEAAMEAVGRVDRYEKHRNTPLETHLDEFIEGLRAANRAPRYVAQVEARIRGVLKGLSVERLDDLDPVAVARFLSDLARKKKHSGITHNEYVASIKSFTRWAVTFQRIKDDPLAGLRVTERRAIEPKHPRRALRPDEVARLLDAADRRPMLELQTVRTGENKGKPLAKVGEKATAIARRKGEERRLVYMLAVWTGLRRNEIRQLAWGDVHLGTLPGHLTLRAVATKSKRADTLPIHTQLANELLAWRPPDAQPTDRVVTAVPNMLCFRADLKLAGIADKDEHGRYVDFHSLRVSLSTMLAANKVSPRAAQALMRHTDPRLTANVYTDEKLLPLAAELQSVPTIEVDRNNATADALDGPMHSLVANLSAEQRQALLQALQHARAG